ncbi:MAG: transcription-repair coupling factor [Bdellovibrionales bacterium]|nr:transcription-repair coupling factor [Bdellovibrionales bacterium]
MKPFGRYHGVTGAAAALMVSRFVESQTRVVAVVPSDRRQEEFVGDLRFFLPQFPVFVFPPYEPLPFEPTSPDIQISASRNYFIRKLLSGDPGIFVIPASAFLWRILPREFYSKSTFEVAVGDTVSAQELYSRLSHSGYISASNVEVLGEIAIRGGGVDVFAPAYSCPIRIQILGGTVTSLRAFDAETQRSIDVQYQSVELDPARERLFWGELLEFGLSPEEGLVTFVAQWMKAREIPPSESSDIVKALQQDLSIPGIELYQYILPIQWHSFLEEDVSLIVIEREECVAAIDDMQERIDEREARFVEQHYCIPHRDHRFIQAQSVSQTLQERVVGELNAIHIHEAGVESQNLKSLPLTELSIQMDRGDKRSHPFLPVKSAVEQWRKRNCRVGFVIGSSSRARRLQRILLELELDVPIREDLSGQIWIRDLNRLGVVILSGCLGKGVALPNEKIVLVSESEIFGEQSFPKKETPSSLKKLLNSLSQLAIDDFVVHIDYGIGRYKGFVHRKINGIGVDLLQIEYADSMLFLPMVNISKIERFSATEGQQPRLDKLSSTRWQKTKARVRQSVELLAGDLVKLYAARSISKGWRFDPAGAEDERFADGFPYQETRDQLQAIESTLANMAEDRPMDRLICGDVGFGKTEIAMRAAYKATQHAKQVAVLAPTTLLVEQHRATFAKRFAEFPVKVAAVSRYAHPKENRATLEKVAHGKIDIILGTHRLLQRDVKFADLGLVIIDEEHRFGVKQKERFKQLKKSVDVLTLTATPIPRTLYMSLLNLRDISIIATPPVDRRTVRTYVTANDENVVRDAILRELQREGQVFFVHNRVQGIEGVAASLAELVPEARISFAHGQMSEGQLEKIMHQFLKREIDVLVCTTIIESGIDIPNANTILIDRADRFGLAQLYQLRGRVGRSHVQAYCYFLVPKKRRLTGEAQKRLQALQSLDELGIGFQLAVSDLEIRGAGNLLGKEQSGNVLSVGFDLYTRILQEAIHHLTGEDLEIDALVEPEVKVDINAFIPEESVPDLKERMVLYQRLSGLDSQEGREELRSEMEDRFGPLGESAENLLDLMAFRGQLRKFGVEKCECTEQRISLRFASRAPVNLDRVLELVRRAPGEYRLGGENSLVLRRTEQLLVEPPLLYERILSFLAGLTN